MVHPVHPSQLCSICQDPKRQEIEFALVGHNGDKPLSVRATASHFGISRSALQRHVQGGHISSDLVRAKEQMKVIQTEVLGQGIIDQLKVLEDKAMSALDKAEHADDMRMVASFIHEARENLKFRAELEKKIGSGIHVSVNVMTDPEFIQITDRMYKILEPYPDIRAEIAEAMEG